jgi:hypothetical protein
MTAWIVEPGSSGNNVSAPHKSALDAVATSVLIVAYVALDDWTPATAAVIFSVYGSTVGDGMIRATIDTSGHMAINVVSTATGVLQTGSTTTVLQTASGIADGAGIWLFWTYRASTGSCDFRYSLDPPTTAPTAVTWTALQTARSSGTSGQLQTSTAPMQVGGFSTSGGTQPLAGKVYRALLYKASTTGQITTASGQTLLADCDPNQWTSGTTFVSGGDTWTLNGTASIASDSTPKSGTDTGAGTDNNGTIAATSAGTDSGAGSNNQSIAATSSGTDTGAGSDAQSIAAALAATADTGAGTDAGVKIAQTVTDSGAGSETGVLAASSTGTDTGAGTEALPKIAFTATDTGAATESFSIIVPVSASDSGAGTDLGSSVQAALSASETGAGADTGSVRAALAASETAAGSDLASSVHAAVFGTDTGTDVESGVPFTGGNTTPSGTDSGVGTDAGQVTYKELRDTDSGTSLEIRYPMRVRKRKLTLLQAAMGMVDVQGEARRDR